MASSYRKQKLHGENNINVTNNFIYFIRSMVYDVIRCVVVIIKRIFLSADDNFKYFFIHNSFLFRLKLLIAYEAFGKNI